MSVKHLNPRKQEGRDMELLKHDPVMIQPQNRKAMAMGYSEK